MIRPPRRGVGGLRGTLFFQTDRGAAGEHVDSGPEEAHAGFQAVRALTFAWLKAPPHSCGAAGRGSGTLSSHNPMRADRGPSGTDGSPVLTRIRTPPSLLAHSSDARNFDYRPPPPEVERWLWSVQGFPAAHLGQLPDVGPRAQASSLRPCILSCPPLSPRSRPLKNLFSCLLHQFSGIALRSSLRGRVGAKSAPPILSAVRVGSAARGPEVVNPSSETRLSLTRPKGP